ncbi:hypothetical protein PV08_06859 [Exophiala spinifera]|uniref:DUF3669 domain-containing protein n=1 Tax=Exophiala spinifera TaxID=91928 RepID=A0A0D2B5B1_9EURO|nr:uncharacterized protein PV08_06859 [Exophiala spinifera]KIW14078.1 hypothetical protein PV08_06859 [Exophiala spinifera]
MSSPTATRDRVESESDSSERVADTDTPNSLDFFQLLSAIVEEFERRRRQWQPRWTACKLKKAFLLRHHPIWVTYPPNQLPRHIQPLTQLRKIAQGGFGAVYAHPDQNTILKRELNPSIDSDAVQREHHMHHGVFEAMMKWNNISSFFVNVQVPRDGAFISAPSSDWDDGLQLLFPDKKMQCRADMIQAERIPAVPAGVLEDIIRIYCHDPETWPSIAASTEAKDCLVRIYLGGESIHSRAFNIGNFSLHIDQLEALDVNTLKIAGHFGRALAVIHSQADLDGRGIEFVLGGARDEPDGSQIWVLDFDQCRPLHAPRGAGDASRQPMVDSTGSVRAPSASEIQRTDSCIDAFFENDPYFPRPGSKRPALWNTFARNYDYMTREIAIRSWASAENRVCYNFVRYKPSTAAEFELLTMLPKPEDDQIRTYRPVTRAASLFLLGVEERYWNGTKSCKKAVESRLGPECLVHDT